MHNHPKYEHIHKLRHTHKYRHVGMYAHTNITIYMSRRSLEEVLKFTKLIANMDVGPK